MPQVPVMNYHQAWKFNPNSTVSAQLDVIDSANNQAKAVLKVGYIPHIPSYIQVSVSQIDGRRVFIAEVLV
jgi:hypothetical protein